MPASKVRRNLALLVLMFSIAIPFDLLIGIPDWIEVLSRIAVLLIALNCIIRHD